MNWENPVIYIIPAIAVIGALVTVGIWIGNMNSFKDTVGDTLKEIRDDIKKLFERLPPAVISEGSPISLTELGRSISEEIGASTWAEEQVEGLLSKAIGKQPYEIQKFSFDYVEKEFMPSVTSGEFYHKMLECAYNNGVSMDKVGNVLAVELRDALLEGLRHVG